MASMPAIDLGMSKSDQQEAFGDGLLLALAAAAGCGASRPCPDDDSVDWTLSCRLARRPKIDVQMKTWIKDDGKGPSLRYPLKLKNYNDLRMMDVVVPRLLILVSIPEDVTQWTKVSPAELILRKCAFWVSLLGQPDVPNEATVTVHVPRVNALTPDALKGLMHRANDEVPL